MRCKIWCIQTTDRGTKEVKNYEGELSVLALHILVVLEHGTLYVCIHLQIAFLVKIHCNWDIFWHLRLR